MTSAPLTLDTLELINPKYYEENGYPYDAWKLLRDEAPAYWFDRLPGTPFWAITRHEDIVRVSRQPERFLNAPRLVVGEERVSELRFDQSFPNDKTLLDEMAQICGIFGGH